MRIDEAIGAAIAKAADSGADGGLALIIALVIVVSRAVAIVEAICGVFKRRRQKTEESKTTKTEER